MNTWRIALGQTTIAAHTDAIRNGQETEPLDTQAIDAITNILHCLYATKRSQLERRPFSAEQVIRIALDNFNAEI